MQSYLDRLNQLWKFDDLFSFGDHWESLAVWATALVAVGVLAYALGWIVRAVIGGLIAGLARKTETKWDDYLFDKKFFHRLGNLIPSVASYFLFLSIVAPGKVGTLDGALYPLVTKVLLLWICWAATSFFVQLSTNWERGYREVRGVRQIPMRSYVQVVQLFVYMLGGVLAVSVVLDQNPLGILGGLGAMTAVLLLVFKDTLLGLVASLQVSSNKLVQVGDRVEFPSLNIEGEVVDIALSVVKIKSGDNTVYSMPTYNLVSLPFKNWSHVADVGARRLKLAFPVDALTIAPLASGQEKALRTTGLWKVPEDLKGVSNAEAFRFWCQDYLDGHAQVHKGEARLVKLGQPVGRGLPFEMVFYTQLTTYPDWEHLSSRLLSQFLATLPEFGLRVFQEPVGVVSAPAVAT
ncbi:MAG: mechanosensitive ion channel family protein [Spirochaetales bacterium]